jgi:hypothetical protein
VTAGPPAHVGPTLTPNALAAAAETLRATSERLRSRTSASLAAALGTAGGRFLDPTDPLRAEALERLPESSGLSSAVARVVLDQMAADWTEDRLRRLLATELGDPCPLDTFVPRGGGRSIAIGPALCAQIAAGGVPGVGVTALARSLLVKGPTLLKVGRDDALLPLLYARSLAEVDPELAGSLAVMYWPGDSTEHLDAALAHADIVVAYGSDASVAAVRARAPVTARFVGYHHRVSIGLVGRDALTDASLAPLARDIAWAVSAYDQRGCVSPRVVYVEEGGERSPAELAEQLASAMGDIEARSPTGALDAGHASTLQQARGTAELMAAADGGHVHHGGAAAWTVWWAPSDVSAVPTAGRFVVVRPVADASMLPKELGALGPHLQTVAVAGLAARLDATAKALGEAGASRIAPFRAVPFPPPWWHHDGRGPLLDLVRWMDLERPEPVARAEEATLPASAARLAR